MRTVSDKSDLTAEHDVERTVEPAQTTPSPASENARSAFSIRSMLSFGSISSFGSFFSIASLLSGGSVLSIGSAGSILSIGSNGSVLSIGSTGSILSIGGAGTILHIAKPSEMWQRWRRAQVTLPFVSQARRVSASR